MKLKKQYLIGAAITVGLLASLGGMAFAAADSALADSSAPKYGENANRPVKSGVKNPREAGFGDRGLKGQGNGFFNGLIAFAANKDNGEKPGETGGIEGLTATFVAEGIISSTTADQITAYAQEQKEALTAEKEKLKAMTKEELKAYFDSKKTDGTFEKGMAFGIKGNGDILAALVEKNILTLSEADAITSYLKAQMETRQAQQQAERTQSLSDELAILVSQNLLTQAKADEMLALYTTEQAAMIADRQAEMEKLKAMTEEERTAYWEGIKADKADSTPKNMAPGAALVEKGILTQEEADKIRTYYKEQFSQKSQEKMTEKLAGLVADGTITADQQAKIAAALNGQDKTEITISGEKTKMRMERVNPLQSLVDDGTITQEQANLIFKTKISFDTAPERLLR